MRFALAPPGAAADFWIRQRDSQMAVLDQMAGGHGPRRCSAGPRHALKQTLLMLCAASVALTLAGCASNPMQHESSASSASPARSPTRPRVRRADLALLAVQPAPDCEFVGGPEPNAVDPDLWQRLKLDYEQNCYKQAEALVRKRLRLLQTSRLCRIEPEQRRRWVTR
jgi:hypothetical protein